MNSLAGTPAAHDLIKLSPQAVTRIARGAPDWVSDSLDAAPWAVVRRARPAHGRVACGLRGAERSMRFACELFPGEAAALVRPEDLIARRPSRDVPAMRSLAAFRDFAEREQLTWGPTGSVGFELATARPVTGEHSDCDIILRARDLSRTALLALARSLESVAPGLDVEADFGDYAFALREVMGPVDRILAKTPDGPSLISWTTRV